MHKKTIMITGPHAIGKTTTATKLYEKHPDYMFLPSVAGKIAKDMDYDLNDNPTPQETLAYQKRLLTAFQMQYETTLELDTVFDRSPLDLAAYLYLQLKNVIELQDEVQKYIQQCILTTMGYCHYLIIPEADLEEPYETKGNRPAYSEEQVLYRKEYIELVKKWAEDTKHLCKVIHVPVDKQYDERIKFIEENAELV